MTRHFRYWCPYGCGKKVYLSIHKDRNFIWRCNGCSKNLTKLDLSRLNNVKYLTN